MGQRSLGGVVAWTRDNDPEAYRELWAGGGDTSVAERPLLDVLRDVNTRSYDLREHRRYLRTAQLGRGEDYVGIDWLMWWYRRNLCLFKNITDLARTPGDRVFMLIGASHRSLPNRFLEDAGRYRVEDALTYLG